MREEPKFLLGEAGAGIDADANVATGMEADSGVGANMGVGRTWIGMGAQAQF